MKKIIKYTLLVLTLLLLANCSKPLTEPTASTPRWVAETDAKNWVKGWPERYTLPIIGNSMLPAYGPSMLLGLEKVVAKDIKIGQDVVFQNTEKILVVHRALEVSADGVLFGGINNKFNDGWIRNDAVLYRVAAVFYTDPKSVPLLK